MTGLTSFVTCLRCGSRNLDVRVGLVVCSDCGWCLQDVRVAR